jgi:hypothetical protein
VAGASIVFAAEANSRPFRGVKRSSGRTALDINYAAGCSGGEDGRRSLEPWWRRLQSSMTGTEGAYGFGRGVAVLDSGRRRPDSRPPQTDGGMVVNSLVLSQAAKGFARMYERESFGGLGKSPEILRIDVAGEP